MRKVGRRQKAGGRIASGSLARRHCLLPTAYCVLALLSGCAGYHVGTAGLFPPDIHTVYVPMFESESFRRDLGEQLTEAVCKEIETRGPFKVVGTPNADSVLTGRIKADTKHTLIREPNNEARNIEMGLIVEVSWADRHGNIVRDGQVPLPPEMVALNQTTQLIPEYGGSTVAAQQQVMKRLARQIVDLMQVPW
jgi:lipopolysaccharide assembly LptE-like protein